MVMAPLYPTLRTPASTRRVALAIGTTFVLPGAPRGGIDEPVGCEEAECVADDPATGAPSPSWPLDVTLVVEAGTSGGLAFVVTATNLQGAPLTLVFRNGQWCDVLVAGSDGAPIWRWSERRVFTQAIREVSLAPGESRAVRLEWPDAGTSLAPPAAPWTAWATWVSDPGGASAPVAFGPEWPPLPGA